MSKKTYDLDAKDFFWAKNAQNPFPQVAEEIDLELNKYVSGVGFRAARVSPPVSSAASRVRARAERADV